MSEKNKVDEIVLMGVAAQLRKPSGEYAVKTAERMNIGNAEINRNTFEVLQPAADDTILEIGMGNGKFVQDIFTICPEVKSYTGYDYSEEMIQESITHNGNLIKENKVEFIHGSVDDMPFDDCTFSKIFTVNTLYFWDEREKILNEIERVLKPNGQLIIAIRPSHEMSIYPMTKWGFKMYTAAQLTEFLEKNDWYIDEVVEKSESPQEIAGEMMPVSSLIVKATKIE